MKKTVERKRELPSFSIDLAELEILWGRLLVLFDQDQKIYTTIRIKLSQEELQFDSLEELKQYSQLKGKLTDFSFFFSQASRRHVRIRSGYFFKTQMEVIAEGESEAWCAGAVETVFSFMQNHKVWYHWLVAAPLGWILFFLANLPSIVGILLPSGVTVSKFLIAGWLAILIAIAILYLLKRKFLPSSVLCISSKESFIQKYGVEISLFVSIISAVLTAIGVFVSLK